MVEYLGVGHHMFNTTDRYRWELLANTGKLDEANLNKAKLTRLTHDRERERRRGVGGRGGKRER